MNPQLYSGALRMMCYSLMEQNKDVRFDVSDFLPSSFFFYMKTIYKQVCSLPGPILLLPRPHPCAVFMHESENLE